jgi:hypothetical protein
MKTYKNTPKGLTTLFSIICLAAFMLSSCSKSAANFNYSPPIAGLAFIQASADEPAVDLLVNNSKYSTTPITYGQSFSYVTIFGGKIPVAVNNDATGKTMVADTIQFAQDVGYTMFLCNTVSQPQLFLLTDTLAGPGSGMSSVRFVNVCPDAGPVDLVVKGGATITGNKSFKGHSSFSTLPANVQYTFEVHQAGTATVLASVIGKFNPGFVYTIWFHGLTAGTAGKDGLAADIFTNGYFQ